LCKVPSPKPVSTVSLTDSSKVTSSISTAGIFGSGGVTSSVSYPVLTDFLIEPLSSSTYSSVITGLSS
jgi:hypothetical protein